MADFRTICLDSLGWFPCNKKLVPVTPVRFQVPPSACCVSLLPGRYNIKLSLAGHALHEAFVAFMVQLDKHALQNAKPNNPNLKWYSCTNASTLVPVLSLSAFDGSTRWFDADGRPALSPTNFESCSCLLELTGAWMSETHWGLRLSVLEVKHVPRSLEPFMFIDDTSNGHGGKLEGSSGNHGGDNVAKQVQASVDGCKTGHARKSWADEDEDDEDDGNHKKH